MDAPIVHTKTAFAGRALPIAGGLLAALLMILAALPAGANATAAARPIREPRPLDTETPTVTATATFAATPTATPTASATPTATCGPMSIAQPPDGYVGQEYQAWLQITGAQPPYTLTEAWGNGLFLQINGFLWGTPVDAGETYFSTWITDARNCVSAQSFSVRVWERAYLPIVLFEP
jgi:hypothetical protein